MKMIFWGVLLLVAIALSQDFVVGEDFNNDDRIPQETTSFTRRMTTTDKIGSFSAGEVTKYQVSGDVHIIDKTHLLIKNFHYTGGAPDAHFWVGTTETPDKANGLLAPLYSYEADCNKQDKLTSYSGADVIVQLPISVDTTNLYISVYCVSAGVYFAVYKFQSIPAGVQTSVLPSSCGINAGVDMGNFIGSGHQLRGRVRILDQTHFLVTGYNYDGGGPDAYWYVWKGDTEATRSDDVKKGEFAPPIRYSDPGRTPTCDREILPRSTCSLSSNIDLCPTTIVELPAGKTFQDFDFMGMYCVLARSIFGFVKINHSLITELPPMVESRCSTTSTNCETLLPGRFNVMWEFDKPRKVIKFVLQGSASMMEYMAFGISSSSDDSVMIKSDVAVAYVDTNGDVHVDDYYLEAYSQCSNGNGVCPDTEFQGSNNILQSESEVVDGITTIKYERYVRKVDEVYDLSFNEFGETTVVWARGVVDLANDLPLKHEAGDKTETTLAINFFRDPVDNCEAVSVEVEKCVDVFEIPPIINTTIIRAEIGDPGGMRGYKGITKQGGWGIVWYLNDHLAPEVFVERGVEYTFLIYGGNNKSEGLSRYHPFYLTQSADGGYERKSDLEKQQEKIVAGLNKENGDVIVGSYCEFTTTEETEDAIMNGDYEQYRGTLNHTCYGNDTGELKWTPDSDTPNLVYYQCATHGRLGWKIHVLDKGEDYRSRLNPPMKCDEKKKNKESINSCTVTVKGKLYKYDFCKNLQLGMYGYWNIDEKKKILEMTVKRDESVGWLAFGFSKDGSMVGSDAVVGWRDQNNVGIEDFHLGGKGTNAVKVEGRQGLIFKEMDNDTSAGLTMRFIRRFNPLQSIGIVVGNDNSQSKRSVDAKEDNFVLIAKGSDVPSGLPVKLKQHSERLSFTLDFSNPSNASTVVSGNSYKSYVYAHAVMMVIAWAVLIPIGLITAHFFKHHNPLWFNIHRACNCFGLLLAIISWIIGLAEIGSRTFILHMVFGNLAMSLGIIQPLNAFFRPHKDEPYRLLWEFFHHWGGRLAVLSAVINMFVGLDLFNAEVIFFIALGILCGVIVIATIVFIINPPSGGTPAKGDSIGMEDTRKSVV